MVEEICEEIVVEQLLSTMPSDLHVWVRETKPESGDAVGKLADDYLQARRREPGPASRNYSAMGAQRKMNKTRRCHNCGKEGHLARSCTRKASDSQEVALKQAKSPRKTVKCYNCGNMGNMTMQYLDKALFVGKCVVWQLHAVAWWRAGLWVFCWTCVFPE